MPKTTKRIFEKMSKPDSSYYRFHIAKSLMVYIIIAPIKLHQRVGYAISAKGLHVEVWAQKWQKPRLKRRYTDTFTHFWVPGMKRYVQKAYRWCMCMVLSVWVWRKVGYLTQPEMWQCATEVMLGRNRCCRRVNLSVDQSHPPTQHEHTWQGPG